jgi:hypothetical protein
LRFIDLAPLVGWIPNAKELGARLDHTMEVVAASTRAQGSRSTEALGVTFGTLDAIAKIL